VFGELWRVDHQQRFVVGVSSRGAPIEAAGDHFFVVDHSKLVVDILEMCISACGLRGAQAQKASIKAALTDWTG